jgi:hypothetical protein
MTDSFGDAVLAGFFCDVCLKVIDEVEPGYPRTCPACVAAARRACQMEIPRRRPRKKDQRP